MNTTFVEKHFISKNHEFWQECDFLTYVTKNLRNKCIYELRQLYFETGSFIYKYNESIDLKTGELLQTPISLTNYAEMYHFIKDSPEFRTAKHKEYGGFKAPVRILKAVLRQVDQDFRSFWKSILSFQKDPSKFTGRPNIPGYSTPGKKGRFICSFNYEALSFKKEGFIRLSGTEIYIPIRHNTNLTKENVLSVDIVPEGNGYNIIIVYDTQGKTKRRELKQEKSEIESDISINFDLLRTPRVCGIDLGLNNIVALTSNDPVSQPIVINGRHIKSINQFYNKNRAKMQSDLAKIDPKRHQSRNLQLLTGKRNRKMETEIHRVSKFVVDYLIENAINAVIIGRNKGWKDEINIGRKSNQNFVCVPHAKLIHQIQYKCEMTGIKVYETEESYTSKCSFLDMEPLQKREQYLGKRVNRGLFISSSGAKLNADLNGSLNIIRKVAGNEAFCFQNASDLVEGFAVSPLKVCLNS